MEKLHIEELCDLYPLSGIKVKSNYTWQRVQIVELLNMQFFFLRMEGKRNAYRILVGKPEGKRRLGKPRCGRMESIKIDL
jgi:hypothetical protein